MPDSVPLIDDLTPGSLASLQRAKSLLVSARLLSTWLWLAPASLLGLVVALVVRSWSGLFRWWGIPVLVGGLAGIALASLGNGLGMRWLEGQLAVAVRDVPAVLQGVVSGMVEQLYQAIVRTLMRQSFLVAGGAGIVTLLGVLSRSGSDADQPINGLATPDNESAPAAGDDDDERPSGMFG
jgi:hypothetical protein